MEDPNSRYSKRIRHVRNFRYRNDRFRSRLKAWVCVVLAVWMICAYIAVFIAYLVTRDTTIALIWTSCAALATVAFSYFFHIG